MKIGDRIVGPGHPVFIIAEMSGNHNQKIENAYKLIDVAVEAGVDAVKLQTYTPDTLTIDCDKKWFQIKGSAWDGNNLYKLYGDAYTPWDWQPKLKKYAEDKGIMLFSTPFDNTAVDFLEKMNVAVYKVASFENGDLQLLKKIASTGKPVIMSRGMANLEDIELAVKTLKENGTPQVAVLHCISSYPATPEEMNLATIADIAKRFNIISGLSDHTLTITASIAAAALGASIIEKHFTLKKLSDRGPDAAFSIEPDGLKQLVTSVREIDVAIGKPNYEVKAKEKESAVFKRSIFVVKDIKKGDELTDENIRSIRPGYGLAPKYWDEVIGKTATQDIERGTPLSWDLINK